MYKKIVLGIIFLMVACVCSQAIAQQKDLSKEELISIATIALKEKGMKIEDVQIIYDEEDKLWQEHLGKITIDEPNYGVLKRGFLKNYKTIYFDFKEPIKDVWIFIDKDTGEVFEIYQE